MGAIFGSPKIPTPPPPPPPSTIRDEVGGVEQVPVKNADGSTTYVTRKIPLTPEQQAEQDQLKGIMTEALAQIQKLSATDYTDTPETKAVLDKWQEAQTSLLGKNIADRTRQEEERLAQRGLADSSIGEDVRRKRLLDKQEADKNLSLTRDELSQQVRGQKLALQQNLYNVASSEDNADTARTFQAATKVQSEGLAADARRQASLLDYYNQSSSRSIGDAFGQSLGYGLGGALGRGLGGGVFGGLTGGPFGAVGGFLGSLFRR